MLQFNKYSAWITVDDKPLEEYEVKVDEATSTVTCWIASELGKMIAASSLTPKLPMWARSRFRSLKFALKQTDCLGDLEEYPYRKSFTKQPKRWSITRRAVAVKRHKDVEVDFIGSPVAVFHFRYRPLAILQAKEIAPRPSLPLPTSGTRWKQELNSNGGPIAELLKVKDEDTKRIKDLQVTKVEDIKPARVELDALQKKRSQKNGEGPRKKPKREPIVGLTIDLTKD
ncbi:hypothetical protein V5O48_018371 [Marasmius crinis-equi]|uniref:Uncharacterized protein n=1 Tax=Marasmius crinis-equi TaxID=585013 RepID=A0ABR3ELC4_9AGAR